MMASKQVLKYGDNLFLFHVMQKVGVVPDLILEILHEKQDKLTLIIQVSCREDYNLDELETMKRFTSFVLVFSYSSNAIKDLKLWLEKNNKKYKILLINNCFLLDTDILYLSGIYSPNFYLYFYSVGERTPPYIDLPIEADIFSIKIFRENDKKNEFILANKIFSARYAIQQYPFNLCANEIFLLSYWQIIVNKNSVYSLNWDGYTKKEQT